MSVCSWLTASNYDLWNALYMYIQVSNTIIYVVHNITTTHYCFCACWLNSACTNNSVHCMTSRLGVKPLMKFSSVRKRCNSVRRVQNRNMNTISVLLVGRLQRIIISSNFQVCRTQLRVHGACWCGYNSKRVSAVFDDYMRTELTKNTSTPIIFVGSTQHRDTPVCQLRTSKSLVSRSGDWRQD